MLDYVISTAKGGRDSAARRESGNHYQRVICMSDLFWLIVCRENIQWIVQAKVMPTKPRATKRWKALKYFRTQRGLAAFWHSLHAAQSTKSWPDLDRLPDNFGGK